MMTAFYRETKIKAIRQPRQCEGCCKMLEKGDPAIYYAGKPDGDFCTATYHQDCREAEVALNEVYQSRYADEWIPLHEIEWDDYPWLIEKFPTVAARMNITTQRYEKAQQHIRSSFLRMTQ